MRRGRRMVLGSLFGLILLAVTLVGIEVLSSFYVPDWPARALNPRPPAPVRILQTASRISHGSPIPTIPGQCAISNGRSPSPPERSAPSSSATASSSRGSRRCRFRRRCSSAFLAARTGSRRSISASPPPIRAATTTGSATWPWIAARCVLLFIYAGNDFMAPDQGYSVWPRWIDESAGRVAGGQHHAADELVDGESPGSGGILQLEVDCARQRRSDAFRRRHGASRRAPQAHRVLRQDLSLSECPEEQLAEILSRGDNRFFNIAAPRQEGEQEYLLDWMFGTLMSWEARDFEVAKGREDAERMAGKGQVEATFSWIEATDRLLRKHGVPLVVFLVPMGSVDPDYADFWKPWPRTLQLELHLRRMACTACRTPCQGGHPPCRSAREPRQRSGHLSQARWSLEPEGRGHCRRPGGGRAEVCAGRSGGRENKVVQPD